MIIDTEELEYWVGKDGQVSYSEDENPDENPDRVGESEPDGFRTASERVSDGVRTLPERVSDDTPIENRSEKPARRTSQTLAATVQNGLLPATTPRDYVELYADVVSFLNNRKFLKEVIGQGKLKYTFSVPKEVCRAINEELGTDIKKFTFDKIQYSRMYCKRFSPLAFWSLAVVSLMLLFGIWWIYQPKASGQPAAAASEARTREQDSIYIQGWAQKRNFVFWSYRIGLMHSDPEFQKGSDADRERIMQHHMEQQQSAKK